MACYDDEIAVHMHRFFRNQNNAPACYKNWLVIET